MKEMGETERNQMLDRMKKECICTDCPSYNDCAKMNGELLFCSIGKSPNCIIDEKGCICPECPIAKRLELENVYFCTRGSEREQRGM